MNLLLQCSSLLTEERQKLIGHSKDFILDLDSDPDANNGQIQMQEALVDRNIEAKILYK